MDQYEDAEALSDEALRQCLIEGDNPERIWSAWALAQRLGADSIAELKQAAGISANPGVRRHVAIVLAGLGEFDVLRTLAVFDPDELVRATALRQLGLSALNDQNTRNLLAGRLSEDPSDAAKAAILDLHSNTNKLLSTKSLLDAANHSSEVVRRAAFLALSRSVEPEVLFQGPFAKRLALENQPNLLQEIVDHAVGNGAPKAILLHSAEADEERGVYLRGELLRRKLKFSWAEIEQAGLIDQVDATGELLYLWDQNLEMDSASWFLDKARAETSGDADECAGHYLYVLGDLASFEAIARPVDFTETVQMIRTFLERSRDELDASLAAGELDQHDYRDSRMEIEDELQKLHREPASR